MLRINNVNIYGMNESIRASGYPMRSDDIGEWNDEDLVNLPSDIKRAEKLGNVPTGTGHDNFLKGIIVQFDVTYPQYWTPQFQRYHFADIVSSNSKMHRLVKMNIKDCCNEYVDDSVIENLNKWIDIYNNFEKEYDKVFIGQNNNSVDYLKSEEFVRGAGEYFNKYQVYMKIISNTPMGLEQTMRVTTSYLQLKTIYLQRRHHKLKEDWGNFCDWCLTLPNFEEFCLKNK